METPRVGIPGHLASRMTMPEQHEFLREKIGRRGLLRAGTLVAGTVAGAGLLGSSATTARVGTGDAPALLPSSAAARVDGAPVAPFGRHLAFGADPKTTMSVSWQVQFAVRNPFLRVGLKPWDLSRRIGAEVRSLHTPSLSSRLPAEDQYYLHVALERLRPGAGQWPTPTRFSGRSSRRCPGGRERAAGQQRRSCGRIRWCAECDGRGVGQSSRPC